MTPPTSLPPVAAGGISLHAVDVASGRPAAGMAVTLIRLGPPDVELMQATLGPAGALDHPVVRGDGVVAGRYEARFAVGDWMRAQGLVTAADGPVFMEWAVFRFELPDVREHVHLPLKFTRWGYALFRGA